MPPCVALPSSMGAPMRVPSALFASQLPVEAPGRAAEDASGMDSLPLTDGVPHSRPQPDAGLAFRHLSESEPADGRAPPFVLSNQILKKKRTWGYSGIPR